MFLYLGVLNLRAKDLDRSGTASDVYVAGRLALLGQCSEVWCHVLPRTRSGRKREW